MKAPVAILAVVLACAATAAGTTASGRTAMPNAPNRSWHDAQAGLTVRYPRRWHLTTRNLTNITEPVPRFAIYSAAAPNHAAVASGEFTRRLRADQVVAIVMEQTPVSANELRRFPPRPQQFTVPRLTGVEGFGDRWTELRFRANQRAFYAFIGVGKRANTQLPTLLRSLDDLHVSP